MTDQENVEPVEHRISRTDVENMKLRLENMLLRVQLKELNELVGSQKELKESLSGTWKLVDSKNVPKFLKATSNAFHNLFSNSDVHLEFIGDVVTTNYQILHKKFLQKSFNLSGIQMLEDDACMTYILGRSLKTVYSEGGVEERFVENGRLHVKEKKNNVECVRIYEKCEQESGGHPLMEQLKRELIELGAQRFEKEMTMEVQNEIRAKEYSVENLKTLKKALAEIESDPLFIKNSIVGKWKTVKNSNGAPALLTFKIEHNRFSEQLQHEPEFTTSIFGVPDADGNFYVVEKNRIIWKDEFSWRKEYFMEGEHLIELYPNKFFKKYEKIGI